VRLKECTGLYRNSILYSEYKNLRNNTTVPFDVNTIIIDNVGILKFLYRYASICYIGGGFGKGIHNILEAAVYNKPVLFGPRFEIFFEAVELINKGGAFKVVNAFSFERTINALLFNEDLYNTACIISGSYVRDRSGATEIITDYIQQLILGYKDT